jgi:hypothetical protein
LTVTRADDDELLQEFLEEERRLEEERMHEAGHEYDDDYVQKQQEEMMRQEQLRQQEATSAQDRQMEQELERIRQQREAEFEANLTKMNDDQQKAALKQKKKDAKVVKGILKAADKENHYAVLGLFNFELTIGPIKIYKYQIGPFTFFRPNAKDVKKAYRKSAMLTHPDKNRDGRATEAFVKVEESASILTDDTQRDDYDRLRKLERLARHAAIMKLVKLVVSTARAQLSRVIWIFKNLLGPFATPIFILGCLII